MGWWLRRGGKVPGWDEPSSGSVLQLEASLLVGKGSERACFLHPEDPGKCVKVSLAGREKQYLNDLAYNRLLARRGTSWKLVPEFHGAVETNLGRGLVFDLVADADGTPSKNLCQHLLDRPGPARTARIVRGLRRLRRFLMRERIIARDVNDRNILCREIDGRTIPAVLIDGIGNADFIPICDHVPFLAMWKIARKWRRFERALLHKHGDNHVLRAALPMGEEGF